jgi:hypothetical protein
MTLWAPQTDLKLHEVEASRVGRMKVQIHINLFQWMPTPVQKPVYEATRRWVFGPGDNLEDLKALLASSDNQEA